MTRFFYILFLVVLPSFKAYSDDRFLLVGSVLPNSSRDVYAVGRPLTNWGDWQDVGGHWCGNFGGNCIVALYLTPNNATNYSYNENNETYTIYKTTDPNVGVVYAIKDRDVAGYTPVVGTQKITIRSYSGKNSVTVWARARLVYIGSGLRNSSSFSIMRGLMIGGVTTNKYNDGDNPEFIYMEAKSITVSPVTCTLTSGANQTVNFGDIKESAFPTIGSVGDNVSVLFQVDCPAGVTLWAGITDVNNPSNRTTALSISQIDGAAQGVGVQILGYNGSNPTPFGTGESVIGSPGLTPITSQLNSPLTIHGEFLARLVRTGTLKPGKVKALMGIVLSYQ